MNKHFILNSYIDSLILEAYNNDDPDIYDPEYYLSIFKNRFGTVPEETKLKLIQRAIDVFQSYKYPLTVYRGIKYFPEATIKSITDHKYNPFDMNQASSWTLSTRIARTFGDLIYVGIIPNENIVDIEYTIENNVLFPHEKEIVIPASKGIKVIDFKHLDPEWKNFEFNPSTKQWKKIP